MLFCSDICTLCITLEVPLVPAVKRREDRKEEGGREGGGHKAMSNANVISTRLELIPNLLLSCIVFYPKSHLPNHKKNPVSSHKKT